MSDWLFLVFAEQVSEQRGQPAIHVDAEAWQM